VRSGQFPEARFDLPGRHFRRVALKIASIGGFPQSRGQRIVSQQAQNGIGKCLRIAGRHQQARLPVLHLVRNSADAGGDERLAQRHAFDDRIGCRIQQRGVDVKVDDIPYVGDAARIAANPHPI